VQLKSLEIKGFKSFADKTILNFDNGVTGVIGPNGCGKSNIVDSIRWVIGEQKISHLRSENLDALVFNGSKSRSASSLAEVSLTFENTKNLLPTEFNTVTITRRFFRNGDSEYRLNDVSCRLKDIQNLLLDTGVSTDSYAIIELGMVDEIIKDKENSRRKMLEQAAGISIYKTRKKEAKSKLDATESDLNRIEDLLFEINNQLKSLENQAKKAEKYFEIKKEYREVSLELAKAALASFNLNYKELTQQLDEVTNQKFEIEAIIATDEAAIESEKLGFIEKEKALQSLQAIFNELQQTVRTKESEKGLAQQRSHYLQERKKGLTDFLSKADGQEVALNESIEFSNLQLEEENKNLQQLENSGNDLQQQVESTIVALNNSRQALDEIRSENLQIQRNQFEAEKKVAVADTSIQNLNRTIQQLSEENTNRESQLKQLNEEKTTTEHDLNLKQSSLQQLQQQHELTKEQLLATQSEVETLRNELFEENRKLDSKNNEHELLKSMIDSMEGYPDSVKFLHKNQDWNHTSPILSDIIYVKEAYRAALENVLDPYLNYYVVSNLQEGLQAVHLLDNNKKGKANFFLLDKFDTLNTQVLGRDAKHPDLTPATEVVEFDKKYEKLVAYLLGKVYVAENEAAIEASNGHIAIEKSGKYVKGTYTLTGGSVGLFEGKKIGRAKNLEKLTEQIAAQKIIVDQLKAHIQTKHNEVIGFNEQLKENAIKETEQEINKLSNTLFAIDNKIENITQSQTIATEKIAHLQFDLTTNQESSVTIRTSLTELNDAILLSNEQLQQANNSFNDAQEQYNSANTLFNDYNLQLAKLQSKVNALQQELAFKANQLQDLIQQKETNKTQLVAVNDEIETNEAALVAVESELITLMQNKDVEQQKLNEADQTYYNLRNILSEKETALRQKQKTKEQYDQSLNEAKDKLNDLKLQVTGTKERLQVEFKINIDDIIDQPRTNDETVEVLQEKADRMKKRLENLGEVNPTAIEAFEEMKKRYDFIVEQKNDLVTAKESLMQTIMEVEATANQKFLDTFNQVRENFKKVFKALFTEDDEADLVLENPENLADTGIDVLAKPKGKRPTSLTQLSGGERTLTATALLFAIYLIKPAPFCILDEVDAPLDDANVGKFTQMIRKFSENSQFIIVTHNKTTMAAVDVIYGVTMQEPGVSKLVPVDFRNLAN
jgi:chromosome segregation protein